MKFRPQIQLRFRSEEQYTHVKALASKIGISINEWILQKLEETERLVRKGKPQATGQKPDEVEGGVPSVSLGGNGPKTGQEGGVPGAAEKSTAPSRSHDPKTCRIYGCGMCKVLKAGV
jgi:hypothetical protein